MPLYVAQLGYSASKLGLLLAIGGLGSGLMTLVVGMASDRWGRRNVLIWVATVAALAPAGYALSHTFWALALASAIGNIGRGGGAGAGGGWGPFNPAMQAILADSSTPRHRNTVFGVLAFVGVIASALGSGLAGMLLVFGEHILHFSVLGSYALLFWVSVALGLSMVLTFLPLTEPGPTRRKRPVGGTKMQGASWVLVGKLSLTNSLNGIAIGILGPFLTYWFHVRFGANAASLSALYTLVNILVALPYLVSATIARRMGAVRMITFTRFLSLFFLVGMAFAPSFFVASVMYIFRVMTGNVAMPIRQSFVMGIAPEADRSRVSALSNVPAQLTSAVSPLLAAVVQESMGLAAPLLLAAAAQTMNGLLYFGFFHRTRPPEEEERNRARRSRRPPQQGRGLSKE